MTKEEIDIQKEIEKYFTESTGFGKDKIRNFMDIVNKALKQKGERIEELENKIADIKANCDLAIEGRDIKIKELEETIANLKEQVQSQVEATIELDKENAELRNNGFTVSAMTEQQLKVAIEKGEQLEKENTELQKEIRCECTRCVYSDSPCIRSDYGVENDEDVCPNYENVFTAYTQLKKENAELKSEKGCETCTKFVEVQLTKAKEIIKDLMSFPVQLCDCRHTVDFVKTREKAVQFLKEIEK